VLHVLFCAAGADAARKTPTLSDIQLNPNPHSWSKTASVLYIDSPAGTGFSYAVKPSDYVTNDKMTIDDLEVFVAQFYEQYKQLRQLQLYIAGEGVLLSGGCYVNACIGFSPSLLGSLNLCYGLGLQGSFKKHNAYVYSKEIHMYQATARWCCCYVCVGDQPTQCLLLLLLLLLSFAGESYGGVYVPLLMQHLLLDTFC
jgi:hypothetical protein